MHLATNVLLQGVLPAHATVRRSFSPRVKGKPAHRVYRLVVDRLLARRHRMTQYFFALEHHLRVDDFRRIVELARGASVEVMTHPHAASEWEVLMSEEYAEAVSRVGIGGHDAL
jgi:hypothetical protein